MARVSSKALLFVGFLCVYIYGTKGRPTNFDDVTAAEDQNKFEESELLKASKANSGGEDEGHKESKGNKKQVIDALHLGPYHHGHPWGTVSQWPGFHWGGHPSRHGGWTGYPTLGGWHKSHISKKNSKKSAHKAALKRQVLPTFAFPTYGIAYPSLGFAAVPFTPAVPYSPVPLGYAAYRSKVSEGTTKGQTRSSVKGSDATKRWWPGNMGGWGGWGIGNEGYPGWGPLGDWGHSYDFGGFGHGWGIGYGNYLHPFLRANIPEEQSKKDNVQKRWWPGYMGGWGGWGLGNSGYPGWGPLGGLWGHGFGGYGYGHGYGLGYGYGHGVRPGFGYGHGFRSDVSSSDKDKDKEEEGPKRGFIHQPFGGIDYPWFGYGSYGYDYPFFGHSQYIPYPEALYGGFLPFYGYGQYAGGPFGYGFGGFHGGHGFYKSKIPTEKSKKVHKELTKEEKALSRNLVHNFHPGRMGWGGAIYPGHGYYDVLPLLGAHTYGLYGGGFYGPYGPPHGAFGPYHRSNVPENTEENSQSRQVINYHPGCCGWGGCIYPGCCYLGGWTWPLPCHHHHHCGPCWTRSSAPKKQALKEEKGKSRQEIENPMESENSESKSDDPKTHPHLEGSELLQSEMQNLAMGFPGIEKLHTPMGLSSPDGQEAAQGFNEQGAAQGFNQQEASQGFNMQEAESNGQLNGENASPEQALAPGNIAALAGITPVEGGNGASPLGNTEEQQEGQQQSAEEVMSNFNMGPSNEGEAPVESFGETGNPNMFSTGAGEEQTMESTSRRADIPGQTEGEITKKQAVAYPYHYLYPGYTMAHGINPFYHLAPINYAQHQLMTYPAAYPLAHAGFIPHPALAAYPAGHPTHNIHVGAPNVNVDVHTTREHVAHSPEKQKGNKLKQMVGEFSEKLKFKSKHGHSSHKKKVTKRQIPSFMSPVMSRPMGFAPPLRYPAPNAAAGLLGGSMFPSMQQPQPFDMSPMGRSGFPASPSPVMGPSPLGLSAMRAPGLRPALTPSQMAISRQLSSITGISLPISAQPGMGIVGMASRKKRSPSKGKSKKHDKSTKRQFLAAPQFLAPTGAFPSFAFPGFPAAPFMGAGLPFLPSFPQAQAPPQQQMAFKPPSLPSIPANAFPTNAFPTNAFSTKMQTPGMRLSGMKMGGALRASQMPVREPSAFSGFQSASPSTQNSPFVKVPQFQNTNFFSGAPNSPMSPQAGAPMRESMQSAFPQAFERNPEPISPEMQQNQEGPFQMNGEQLAGFNPSPNFGVGEPQPSPMFPPQSEGFGPEAPQLPMGPQKEMAPFYQVPGEAGMLEAPRFNMQPGLALKKSAVPNKKQKKVKSSKS